jgi:hypothetical protein
VIPKSEADVMSLPIVPENAHFWQPILEVGQVLSVVDEQSGEIWLAGKSDGQWVRKEHKEGAERDVL